MVEKDLSIVPPGAFIPPAERYDLMPEIDRWVLKKAFAMLPGQIESGRFSQDTLFSINLSGTSIRDLGLIDFIDALQADSDLAPEDICFEITERSAIENLSTATEIISVLRGKGYNFSLDDFGSGLSSFSYLKALPVDFLKIDGMFIQAIAKDPIDRAMVKSINEIGHVMGITTVAEFVEDQAILEILREIGVDYAQGYHVHKPEPI
jgi:EAL domain-containing protein (putative c-di-GMP-specific phosphodiesterase class I)